MRPAQMQMYIFFDADTKKAKYILECLRYNQPFQTRYNV